ncbi:uncharacterized protein TNCV_1079741 [Trichonephila clavipes]|nr:uncharacterized protein TNCV_1079741 [Trichonephila clavipes]
MVLTWTTPELAPPLLTTTPHQREDVSALDRFSVHRCPTRRVFSGTGLELVTKPATIRCLYHSATAALQTEDIYYRALEKILRFFSEDFGSDTTFNEMLCDGWELADEIDIPANFELTQPRHTVRRRNVNFDYEARDDPTLKYKAEFIFSH